MRETNQDYYITDLYHHGIKGQKWGIRRFQKKDGSLTPAGKKRYDESNDADSKTTSVKQTKQRMTHRQKLEAKYRQNGMSEEEAKIAADKRIRTERIVALTVGVTVAAATAYVVNKNIRERTDKIIKSGTKMQRITTDPNGDIGKNFYAAYNKTDNLKYRGIYGEHLRSRGNNVHKVTLNTDKDIKIVSRQKAADVFANLYKNDSEFREAFIRSNAVLDSHGMAPKRDKVVRIAAKKMTDKQLRKAGYDAFNIGLVNHDDNGELISKKFYNKLKEMGYDAVMDVNDQKYSGYKTKAPVIVFNNPGKISVSSTRQMGADEIVKDNTKAYVRLLAPKLVAEGGAYAALYVGSKKLTDRTTVNNYRKEHPNSKLTDKEIIKMMTT